MRDPVMIDLDRHLTAEEKAQDVTSKLVALETERALEEIADGRWDSDLAQHFDPEQLMRVVRYFATFTMEDAARLAMDDLRGIESYIRKEYARDMAERRVLL